MFSDVLTLQWPPEVHPTQLRNFETQARMLRYRALGIACRDRSIRSLLLAHHMDDQAESALMRIAQLSYRSRSVRPMAESVVNLPETWGIHGVHESGLREFQHVVVTKGIRAQMDLHEARSRKLLCPGKWTTLDLKKEASSSIGHYYVSQSKDLRLHVGSIRCSGLKTRRTET